MDFAYFCPLNIMTKSTIFLSTIRPTKKVSEIFSEVKSYLSWLNIAQTNFQPNRWSIQPNRWSMSKLLPLVLIFTHNFFSIIIILGQVMKLTKWHNFVVCDLWRFACGERQNFAKFHKLLAKFLIRETGNFAHYKFMSFC